MTQTSDEGWTQENNEGHFILGRCRLLSQIKSTVLLRKATAYLDSPLERKGNQERSVGGSRKDKVTSDRPKLLRSCSIRDQAEQLSLDILKTAHNL